MKKRVFINTPTVPCKNCGIPFKKTGNNHNLCGSYKKKTGCSNLFHRERSNSFIRKTPVIFTDKQIETRKERAKGFRLMLKKDIYDHYGRICMCCGENNEKFLTLDHINNDGFIERKSGEYRGGGISFHIWLRKKKYPSHIQILCWNCNSGKRVNNGICPHEDTKISDALKA